MIHELENSEDTQRHLHENNDKFIGDCKRVMELLYLGKRLNAKMLVQEYNLHDRRLRECYTARPDIIKKQWKKNEQGKRLFVEYYIEIPLIPTKEKLVQWAGEFLEKQAKLKQAALF